MRRNLAPRGPRNHVGIAEVLDLRGPQSIVARLTETPDSTARPTETPDSTARPTETPNSRDLEKVLIGKLGLPLGGQA
jgi:hypothetical protein